MVLVFHAAISPSQSWILAVPVLPSAPCRVGNILSWLSVGCQCSTQVLYKSWHGDGAPCSLAGREAAVPGSCCQILLQHQLWASGSPRYRLGTSSLCSGAFIILLQRITPDKCQQMTLSPVNEVRFLPWRANCPSLLCEKYRAFFLFFFPPSNVAEFTDVQIVWATSII